MNDEPKPAATIPLSDTPFSINEPPGSDVLPVPATTEEPKAAPAEPAPPEEPKP